MPSAKSSSPPLSIVMPVYNEGPIIERVVREYHQEIQKKIPSSEFLLFEDGSQDDTKSILSRLQKELPIQIHLGEKKKGYLPAAKDAILSAQGEWVLFVDSDGQYLASDFWRLWDKRSSSDLLCGSRREGRQDPLLRHLLSSSYNQAANLLFHTHVSDTNAGFKLMRRSLAQKIVPSIHHLPYGFSTELIARAHHAHYRVQEVPIRHAHRQTGQAEQFTLSRLPKVVYSQARGLWRLKQELS